MWCNSSTLGRNVKNVGSGPALGTIFLIFITPTTQVTCCMVVELRMYICTCIACVYVIVSTKRLMHVNIK